MTEGKLRIAYARKPYRVSLRKRGMKGKKQGQEALPYETSQGSTSCFCKKVRALDARSDWGRVLFIGVKRIICRFESKLGMPVGPLGRLWGVQLSERQHTRYAQVCEWRLHHDMGLHDGARCGNH